MLPLYQAITALSAPILALLLKYRLARGKEDGTRLNERKGKSSPSRPAGQLIWIHAASVGEAQSALILIEKISQQYEDISFLVTSGTVTSANLMAKRLPRNATHQFFPLDHPKWVSDFLDHWKPDLALWMESELWPNMLLALKNRNIPSVLVNARLSDRSYNRWKLFRCSIRKILSSFDLIMAQTQKDADRYLILGAKSVIVTDNLKYSAAPLPCNETDLTELQKSIGRRKIWLYASTHAGEESLACRLHSNLQEQFPDLLTILVPRHPERRDDIERECKIIGLNTTLRGESKILPTEKTQIYVADTLGELGLFYRLSPIAVIGRSFSHDGGGGHNPIEAAQLHCAVLTGPNIQYQTELFDAMFQTGAAKQMDTEKQLEDTLSLLISNDKECQRMIEAADKFADDKNHIIDNVMEQLKPFINKSERKAA
ncbi:MAG TPA: 3-deoxy-D-manno-octulosonic acid transferase [Alphaproteobacteria bacterium]|nr:3-deoxy-D-manno-octulosonic acid transferase [Alphaproteobacteria bacterium]